MTSANASDQRPIVAKPSPRSDVVARIAERNARMAEAIAEGKSDISTDRPLTDDEQRRYGLDEDDPDDEVEGDAVTASARDGAAAGGGDRARTGARDKR